MTTASIVTFHTKHNVLTRLLKCVLNSPIEKIYIIDNSSTDELRDFFKDNSRVDYYHSQLNLGYGAAHNIAIRKAIESGAEYHVVLNPDVYWSENVIQYLQCFMSDSPNVGLVMPKVLYPTGEIQYLCKLLPTPFDLFRRRFITGLSTRNSQDFNYELRWSGYDKVVEVPSLSGCFMFMRCSVLEKIGGFDERYFMYAEDIDLCRRIGEISETIYNPNVTIIHEYDKGSYKNPKLLRYHIKSICKYFNKWGWFFDSKRNLRNKVCVNKIKSLNS